MSKMLMLLFLNFFIFFVCLCIDNIERHMWLQRQASFESRSNKIRKHGVIQHTESGIEGYTIMAFKRLDAEVRKTDPFI